MPLRSKGLTLIELLVAVGLLTLVVLGFTTMDFFSIQQLHDADRRIKMQNELSFIIDDIQKNILRATQITTPNSGRLEILVDRNAALSPGTIAGDTTVIYQLNSASYKMEKTDNGVTEILNNFPMMVPNNVCPNSGFCVSPESAVPISQVQVTLMGRKFPTQNKSASNPEVVLTATMISHSVSSH